MIDSLAAWKEPLQQEIRRLIDPAVEEGEQERAIKERVISFAGRGKLIRGSLVGAIHDCYDGPVPETACRVGAAIEVFHTSALIHDDIIDRDGRRRGVKSFHRYFEERWDYNIDDRHAGESIAICIGDIGYFTLFRTLAELDIDAGRKDELSTLISQTCIETGRAQVRDMLYSTTDREPAADEILGLYRDKTAQYTFVMPLLAGAILADAPDADRERLRTIGTGMGTIYQLKDDEIGLYSPAERNDQGSDVAEDKCTLHRRIALDSLTGSDRERFLELQGRELGDDAYRELLDLYDSAGARAAVRERMERLRDEVDTAIDALSLPEQERDRLHQLARFCMEREH